MLILTHFGQKSASVISIQLTVYSGSLPVVFAVILLTDAVTTNKQKPHLNKINTSQARQGKKDETNDERSKATNKPAAPV